MKILPERGRSFTATAEIQIVPVVIEELCYIGLDYDTHLPAPIYEGSASRHPTFGWP